MKSNTLLLPIRFEIQSSFKIFHLREKFIARSFEKLAYLYIGTLARHRTPWEISLKQLSEMNENSTGYKLFQFLDKNNFQLQYKAESHDIFHILSGYQPTVKDEIGLQFLLLGNGKRTPFLCIALLAGIILLPEHILFYHISYKKGKTLRPFYAWEFEHLLQEDFDSLIQFIHYQATNFKLEL